ncbi:hypothetical protein ACYZTX_00525 [Pseudomonas sp. MDT1-17]
MEALSKSLILTTLALLLGACSANGLNNAHSQLQTVDLLGPEHLRVQAQQVTKVNVGSVNVYSVSMFLYADETPQNYFSFTLDRADVKEGYSTQDVFEGDRKSKAIDANWNGRFYSESRRFSTHAHLTITSLTAQEAVVEVSARLVHPQTGDFIYLPPLILNIRGDDLAVMTEKI